MRLRDLKERNGRRRGATAGQIERLLDAVGGDVPAVLLEYLQEVGGDPVAGHDALLEWGWEPASHDLVDIETIIRFHEFGSTTGWRAVLPAPWIMFGYADSGGGVMAMRCAGEDSPVFRLTEDSDQPSSASLYACSFRALEANLVLPEALQQLANPASSGVRLDKGRWTRFEWQGGALDVERGLGLVDEVLDNLIDGPMNYGGVDVRRALIRGDETLFSNRSIEQRSVSLYPGSLLSRFGGLLATLWLIVALDQLDEVVVDRLGLWSADTELYLHGRDLIDELHRLGPVSNLDQLAERFRTNLAVPCAEKLLAAS